MVPAVLPRPPSGASDLVLQMEIKILRTPGRHTNRKRREKEGTQVEYLFFLILPLVSFPKSCVLDKVRLDATKTRKPGLLLGALA